MLQERKTDQSRSLSCSRALATRHYLKCQLWVYHLLGRSKMLYGEDFGALGSSSLLKETGVVHPPLRLVETSLYLKGILYTLEIILEEVGYCPPE